MTKLVAADEIGTGIFVSGGDVRFPQVPETSAISTSSANLTNNWISLTAKYAEGIEVKTLILATSPSTYILDTISFYENTITLLLTMTDIDIPRNTLANEPLDLFAKADHIIGTSYVDFIQSGNGADRVNGKGGNDLISGQGGADSLFGQAGDDMISAGGGNDLLQGNGGADRLVGGAGQDTMDGGRDTAADVFVLTATNDSLKDAPDTIMNFLENDQISLEMLATELVPLQFGETAAAFGVWVKAAPKLGGVHVLVDVTGDAKADIRMVVVGPTSLSADDFLF